MRIRGFHTFILLIASVIVLPGTRVWAEQLIIPGTGANEVILRELADAFNAEHPGHEVIIPPSVGSGGGIRLVGTGKNRLGRVARDFKTDELKYDLDRLVFARDMVVFVVGRRVGVKDLTSQQLVDVFSGKVGNWEEVGGSDQRVRLLIREPGDSSLLIIRQQLENFTDLVFSDRAKIIYHDYAMVKAINKYSTAIGWLTNASMTEVDSTVTAIAVDGIQPTLENAYDGKYILTGDYALVFEKGNLEGLARQFMDFIFSKKGNRILIKNGIVPVSKQKY